MKRNIIDDVSGSVMIEFSVVALTFFALIPVIFDTSTVIGSSMTLSAAIRAGTQYALSSPDNASGIAAVIQKSAGFPNGSVTVSTSQFCKCLSDTAACGSVCSDGTGAKNFETITASYSVPIILPYDRYPNNAYNISQSATVEIK